MRPLLEFRDYGLAFDGFEGRTHALSGVSLSIEAGESVGIVGETGCGKSVLARSVLRLNPSPPARVLSGAVLLDGQDVLRLNAGGLRRLRARGGVGMVFQDPATYLNPVFTVGTHLRDVLRAHGVPAREVRARSLALMDSVRLPHAADLLGRYPHELSGGMRQRVLIALALAGEPRLLIADEPTTALDVTVQREILALLRDLVARMGLTLLLISHDLGVVGALCRRVVVMYAGMIVEDSPARELFAHPRHPYARGLLDAVPDLSRPDRMPAGIPGSIPALRPAPPPGCCYNPRCPLAMPICRMKAPPLQAVRGRHRAACWATAAPPQSAVSASVAA